MEQLKNKMLSAMHSRIVIGNRGTGDVLAAEACEQLAIDEVIKALEFLRDDALDAKKCELFKDNAGVKIVVTDTINGFNLLINRFKQKWENPYI